MENFINETIDVSQLPQFEEVQFNNLHKSYWKVLLINIGIFFILVSVGFGLLLYFDVEKNQELLNIASYLEIKIAIIVVVFLLILLFTRIGFRKKGYAFRTHDVLFRSGIIATNIIVIPYNRIQHVALHEGVVSRFFGLAKIQIFTAGGMASDIHIPGIEKNQAENIKQLLMGKIQKEL